MAAAINVAASERSALVDQDDAAALAMCAIIQSDVLAEQLAILRKEAQRLLPELVLPEHVTPRQPSKRSDVEGTLTSLLDSSGIISSLVAMQDLVILLAKTGSVRLKFIKCNKRLYI